MAKVVIADRAKTERSLLALYRTLPEWARTAPSREGVVEASSALCQAADHIRALTAKLEAIAPDVSRTALAGTVRSLSKPSCVGSEPIHKPSASRTDVEASVSSSRLTQRTTEVSATAQIGSSTTTSSTCPSSSRAVSPGAIGVIPASHGLVCQSDCRCDLSRDDLPLTEDYKHSVLRFLKSKIKVNSTFEASRLLLSAEVQEEVLRAAILGLPRSEMHKFLRMMARAPAGLGECIVQRRVLQDHSLMSEGRIRLSCDAAQPGHLYSAQQLLFKLFRLGAHSVALEELILTSRVNCKYAGHNYPGELCLNPWHYERTDAVVAVPAKALYHVCTHRLRLNFHENTLVCPRCNALRYVQWKQPDNNSHKISESVKHVDFENAITIKEEVVERMEEDGGESKSEAVESFEKMIGSALEENETAKNRTGQAQTCMNAPKRPSSDDLGTDRRNGEASPGAKRRQLSRCWKCLEYFDRERLRSHPCLQGDGTTVRYVCVRCSRCHEDSREAQVHGGVCRSRGLAAPTEEGAVKDVRKVVVNQTQIVRCQKCNNVLPSVSILRDHCKPSPVDCSNCCVKFDNMCKFVSHVCA